MAIGITVRHIPTKAIAPILLQFTTAPATRRRLFLSDVAAAGSHRERPASLWPSVSIWQGAAAAGARP
jgi:hypothetical protein